MNNMTDGIQGIGVGGGHTNVVGSNITGAATGHNQTSSQMHNAISTEDERKVL